MNINIGAAWKKQYENKQGEKKVMLSGSLSLPKLTDNGLIITKTYISLFPRNKKNDNEPDYDIMISDNDNKKETKTNIDDLPL